VSRLLEGRTILVSGVGLRGGIGTATVEAVRNHGGRPVITCHPSIVERAEKFRQDGEIILPCDFSIEDDFVRLRCELQDRGIMLDGYLHSVAAAPASIQQEGRNFLSMTTEEWIETLSLNALSFHWMSKALLCPGAMGFGRRLNDGAVGVAMTFLLGAEKYIEDYWQMASAKSLLDSIALYLAGDMGKSNVRIHLLDAGPINTIAAKGVKNFGSLYEAVPHAVPLGVNTKAEDVANHIAWLMSPLSGGSPLVHTVDHGLSNQGVMPVRDPRQQ